LVAIFFAEFEDDGAFGEEFIDKVLECAEADPTGDCLGVTDRHLAFFWMFVLDPTTPGISLDLTGKAASDGVLMDVTDQREEVIHVANGFTPESVLEEMAHAFIASVEIGRVGDSDALDDASDGLVLLFDEQMNVIGHQAVSIEITLRRQGRSQLVLGVDLLVEDLDELPIVLIVEEDVLTVDAAEHHVIHASWACLSRFA